MRGDRKGLARVAWSLFDWAAQPFFTLILTFVFAPYFATRVASDPASGQALWGWATAAAGLVVAVSSPVMGALADRSGARKRWVALFSIPIMVGSAALWFAVPGASPIWPVLAAFVVAAVGIEFATVFTNAMLPGLAAPGRIGRLGGGAWALGYLGGLVTLAFMLVFLVADPQSGRTLAGLQPLFGLDAARGEGARAAGPLTALWYFIFVLPLFLLVPETRQSGQAVRIGVAVMEVRTTLMRLVRERGVAARFLLARMLYQDGLNGLFAFGGIYAASVFAWSTTEIGIFGIIIIVSATLGAWIGGHMDDRFGPKPTVLVSLVALLCIGAFILSVQQTRIFWIMEVAAPTDGLFTGTAEKIYLLLGLFLGAVAGPVQSASRSLLIRVSPPEAITEYFGFYALTGRITAFAAPASVALVTTMTGSQRIGIAALLVFLVAGFVLLLSVREGSGETNRGAAG